MNSHARLDRGSYDPAHRSADCADIPIENKEFSSKATVLLDDLRHVMKRDPEAARAAALRLASVLANLAAEEPTIARGGLAPWQKRKVEQYLTEHLDRPIRIHALAQHVRLSVSHFRHSFKKTFLTTPHMYLMRLRLELAKELMLTTQEPLSQIALMCCFADQAHFCKWFRREINDTPGAWRRRMLSNSKISVSGPRITEEPAHGLNRARNPGGRLV